MADPQVDPYAATAQPIQAAGGGATGGSDPYAATAQPIPPPKQGFFSSAADSSGLSMIGHAIAHPIDTLNAISDITNPEGVIATAVHNEGRRAAGELKTAWDQPNTLEGAHQAVEHTLYAIPGVGGVLKKSDEQAAQGNYAGAAGSVTGLGAGMLAPEVAGEVIGGTTRAVKGGVNAVKAAPDAAARLLTNTTVGSTRDLVRKTATTNAKIEAGVAQANKTAMDAREATLESVNAANADARAQALERSQQLHSQAVNEAQSVNDMRAQQHLEKVQGIALDNQAAEEAAQNATDQNRATAQAKYQQDLLDAQDLKSKSGQLARRSIQLKNDLMQNVQNTAASVKSSLSQRFNAVRDKVGDAEAPVAPLAKAAEEESATLGETGDKINQFKSIVQMAQHDAATEELRDIVAKRDFDQPYAELPDLHKSAVDETVQGENPDDIQPSTVTYGQLRRISSKLGSAAYGLSGTDDFLASKIRNVKSTSDAMAHQMARDAGVGAEHKIMLEDWRDYKKNFDEPNGPSQSGSPVAKSVNAVDAYNASQPFLDDDPFVANRAKQMLIGKPKSFGGLYYNLKGGRLVDSLRSVEAQRAALPKPVEPEPFVEPAPVKPELEVAPNRPVEKPIPTESKIVEPGTNGIPALQSTEPPPLKVAVPEQITPESLESTRLEAVQQKVAAMRQLNMYHATKLIGAASGIGITLGKMIGDWHAAGLTGLGIGAAGITGVLGYKMLGKMMDSDAFIAKLAKPTVADYREVMKLPASVRHGVEQAILDLADHAEKIGKLKSPSPWKAVLRGAVAAKPISPDTSDAQPSNQSNNQLNSQPTVDNQ